MRKHFLSWALALVALLFVSIPQARANIAVKTYQDFQLVFSYQMDPSQGSRPLQSGDEVYLTADIDHTYVPSEMPLYVGKGMTLTLDLFGHTIRYEATEAALLHLFDIEEGATLNIIDSKGGGQFILNDKDGNGQTYLFMLEKNATINVYGGSLLCLYNDKAWSRCKAIKTNPESTVNIYDGLVSTIRGNTDANNKVTINIYGGTIGMEAFLSESYDAALWHEPFVGTIKGGKMYGLFGGAALADDTQAGYTKALAADTKVYIDGVLTPSNQLVPERTAYENKLVEVFYEPSFSVNNIAVTSANAADILGDGKVSFDIATNTLYLRSSDPQKMETLSGNINYSDFTLNIVVDGKWKLNGRIVGHDGNLVISAAHPQVMAEENADLLSIEANSTPISLNGKHFTAKHRVRVLINTQNTAVSCGMFVINNAWFEATGQKPVVDCQNSMIQNASITSGSLKNDAAVKIEPNIQKYVLFLMKNIDEAGVVTGDGYYPEGTQVTITAIPNEGYKFLRWDDGEEDQQRYVTMNQDIVLTAIFEADVVIPTYTVNVVSADETMGTVSGGGTDIPEGTVINITATPNSGYQFLYWTTANGQVQGKKETWTVTKDETLTAHFRTIPDPNDYLLWVCGTQVSASNSADILGDGVWCYDHDSRTLTTMKDATYNLTLKDFVQDWITDAGPLTMVVNHNITVTTDDTEATSISMGALLATKGLTIHIAKNKRLDLTAKNMYPLQANGTGLKIDGHGRVDVTLQNTNDKATTAMLLSGTPSLTVDGAWMFVNVPTGCKVSNKTDDNLSVLNGEASGSMSGTWLEISDQTPRYSVNVTPSYNMDLCVYQGAGDYFEGEIVTLRALPATGYKFVAWSDGNTDNPRTFTMPAEDIYLDPIVTEDTEIGQKGAIINANATEGQGTITGFESGWYAEGTELTITAVAAEGYEFVEWSDGKTENPYLLTVVDKQNVSITACFKAIEKEEGVENVQGDDVPCTKVLREGVLYIERNGKIYNAQGAKVK